MGWLLGVQVKNMGGTALAGATVQVLDKDGVQIFSGTTDANGYITSQSGTVSTQAQGSLTLTAQPSDGDTVTLSDGVDPATVFEFDSNSSVISGHVAVTIGSDIEATMANLVAAINAASNLGVTADAFGVANSCTLHNDASGVAGNVAITTTCGNLTVSGLAGGGVFVPVVTTVYDQTGTDPSVITTDTRGPFQVQVSLAGYTPSNQQVTLNQSQNLLVQLASSGGNNPPVAVNDSYGLNQDTVLTVPAAGVLVNDTDADGNPLTAAQVTGPSHGTLTLNANGSFTYTPTSGYHGADSFTYKANDGAADSNVATVSLTINAVTLLAVTINQATGQVDPTNRSPINFTVVFSEPVSDFTTGDVTFSGTAPGTLVGTVTGSGTTYNVAVSGMTGSGTVVASIAAGKAHDAAGNPNAASTSTDNTVTYDVTPPTVTINQATGQADPTNSSPINFTVVFSEAVSDFATGDVTFSGTAGRRLVGTVTGSGTTYNVAVSGMTGSGTVIASIAAGKAHDAAGNPNTASTSTDNTVTYDVTPPAVTINQATGQADPTVRRRSTSR